MREYRYASLSQISKFEPEMKRLGVAMITRSPTGFLTAYKRVKGNSRKLSESWRARREAFIKGHLAQYKSNPTNRGQLALIAWAYMP